jgi:hypothetical protein
MPGYCEGLRLLVPLLSSAALQLGRAVQAVSGATGRERRGYSSAGRSSAVIQPSSEAIRIPMPGMCKGSITSCSAAQNGPNPAAWMAGTEGPAAASARIASRASGRSKRGAS